jgi:endonuclease G
MADDQSARVAHYARALVLRDDVEESIDIEALNTPGASDAKAVAALMPARVPEGYDQAEIAKVAEKVVRADPLDAREQFLTEAIIIPDKRPAVDVIDGGFTVDHPLWLDYNEGTAHANLVKALPSIGRIELPGHPSLPYGGTGFVVGQGLIMTNRHVAQIFATGLGRQGLAFIPGLRAAIDFRQERGAVASVPIAVKTVVMIHPYWDMALLAVDGLDGHEPLTLAQTVPSGADQRRIAVIGYPAFDPRNPAQVQDNVFHGLYNIKRLQPGLLTGLRDTVSFGKSLSAATHDSSTLGGNSGSAVVDAETGAVVALHFGGLYMDTNFGVPAYALARDGRVIDAGVAFEGAPERGAGPWDSYWAEAEREAPAAAAGAGVTVQPRLQPASGTPAGLNRLSVTVPVTITVEVGAPSQQQHAPVARTVVVGAGGAEDEPPIEAPAESYRDRQGYVPGFLGVDVPLPTITQAVDDILSFPFDGREETVLRYEHFSVVMNRPRRLCFFSAVNIDGAQSRKAGRGGWRLDSRIPASQQILRECYGNPPKFSRGHMTRREDPVWGDEVTAARGNDDSMHVTNTAPQMQAFNSPIWLALEDYALQHARGDAMKISVFTGPYFDEANDPVLYGVRIPVQFWKIIAFIHDDTGKLCATGYEMTQKASLPAAGREFVFGEFQSPQLGITTQTSIRAIEQRAGISFNGLADADPRSRATEAIFADADVRLDQIEQIRFLD